MLNWAGTPYGREVSAVHSWAVWRAVTDSDFINDVCMACNAGGGSPHVFPADSTAYDIVKKYTEV